MHPGWRGVHRPRLTAIWRAPADTPLPLDLDPRRECSQRAQAFQGNAAAGVLLPPMKCDSNPLAGRLAGALALIGGAALLLYALWPWLPSPAGRGARPRTVVFYGFSILGEAMNRRRAPRVRPPLAGADRRADRVRHLLRRLGHDHQPAHPGGAGAGRPCSPWSSTPSGWPRPASSPAGSWRRLPHGGVVNRTPFVLVVRKGNPMGIHDFADLARPGVKVVHPDPLTSGGANWALLAEYGSAARRSPGPARDGSGLRGPPRRLAPRRRPGRLGARRPHPVRERLRRRAGHLRAGRPRRRREGHAAGRDRLSSQHRALGAHAGHRGQERHPLRAPPDRRPGRLPLERAGAGAVRAATASAASTSG